MSVIGDKYDNFERGEGHYARIIRPKLAKIEGTKEEQKKEAKKQEEEAKKQEESKSSSDESSQKSTVGEEADYVYDKYGRLLYTKSALQKLENEIEQAHKEFISYLTELSKEDSGKTTKSFKLYGNLTKEEEKELQEIENMIKGKRILKTDPIAKEYNKKVKEFEKRVRSAVEARFNKKQKLRQVRDDLVEKKMLMTGEVNAEDKNTGITITTEDSRDLLSRFARAGGSAKKEETSIW